MEIKNRLMEQAFCLPRGVVGRLGGRLMALDRALPAWVLNILEVGPFDLVLEIGSGPGVGVELAAALVQKGRVVGIDPSSTMLNMARDRNREALEAGSVELYMGTVAALPFDDAAFSVVFTINSIHLWPDPVAGLREVKRTLRRDGRIGVAISRFSYTSAGRFEEQIVEAGFKDVNVQMGESGTCAIART